jgi:hypothetical protein
MAAGGVLIQNAQAANQPHMYSALDHLRAASTRSGLGR